MIAYFKANPDMFPELVASSLKASEKTAWRSALLIGHLMQKEDNRIQCYVDEYIQVLENAAQGHQRQILVILDKMKLTNDQKGQLFNHSLTIWEAVHKIPSTRIRAFWMMEKIAKDYPDLKKELQHFTTSYFTETLSPGIKIHIINNYKSMLK